MKNVVTRNLTFWYSALDDGERSAPRSSRYDPDDIAKCTQRKEAWVALKEDVEVLGKRNSPVLSEVYRRSSAHVLS